MQTSQSMQPFTSTPMFTSVVSIQPPAMSHRYIDNHCHWYHVMQLPSTRMTYSAVLLSFLSLPCSDECHLFFLHSVRHTLLQQLYRMLYHCHHVGILGPMGSVKPRIPSENKFVHHIHSYFILFTICT